MTSEGEDNEEHLHRTCRCNENGRFVVQLPFRDSVDQLKNSRSLALKLFLLLDEILIRNPDLKAQYAAFIDKCQDIGPLLCRGIRKGEDRPNLRTYYPPHHCILKPSSSTNCIQRKTIIAIHPGKDGIVQLITTSKIFNQCWNSPDESALCRFHHALRNKIFLSKFTFVLYPVACM